MGNTKQIKLTTSSDLDKLIAREAAIRGISKPKFVRNLIEIALNQMSEYEIENESDLLEEMDMLPSSPIENEFDTSAGAMAAEINNSDSYTNLDNSTSYTEIEGFSSGASYSDEELVENNTGASDENISENNVLLLSEILSQSGSKINDILESNVSKSNNAPSSKNEQNSDSDSYIQHSLDSQSNPQANISTGNKHKTINLQIDGPDSLQNGQTITLNIGNNTGKNFSITINFA